MTDLTCKDRGHHNYVVDTILQLDENFQIVRQVVKGGKAVCSDCGHVDPTDLSGARTGEVIQAEKG